MRKFGDRQNCCTNLDERTNRGIQGYTPASPMAGMVKILMCLLFHRRFDHMCDSFYSNRPFRMDTIFQRRKENVGSFAFKKHLGQRAKS
jgi:hypothetical protein